MTAPTGLYSRDRAPTIVSLMWCITTCVCAHECVCESISTFNASFEQMISDVMEICSGRPMPDKALKHIYLQAIPPTVRERVAPRLDSGMKLHAVMQLCAQTEYYASLPITSDHSQRRDNALSSASTYVIRSLPSYGSMKERHAAYRKRALRMPIDVYSRLHSHVYRLRSHAKLFTLACVSYAYPLIVACVSIHLSLSGCLSVLYVNYSTCRRQLENGGLAPCSTGDRGSTSERAQETDRADEEMRAQLDRQQRQRE